MNRSPKMMSATMRLKTARRFRSLRARTVSGALLALGMGLLGIGQVCRAQQTWPLWESYAGHIIDQNGRVIDHSAQDHTTSEGQAYGMFFALVAYDLMEAGRLWREPRYQKIGTLMATRIAQQEVAFVPGLGTTLLSGPVGFHPDAGTWLLNPSYLPPFLLAYLAKAIPTGPWRAVLESLQPLLAKGSGAGYAMDWVAAGTEIRPSLSPGQLAAGISDKTPIGSYDAIRVYLWLGIADPATPGVQALLPTVSGMAAYLKVHVTPPEQVDSLGHVLSTNAPPGFSAALIPYLHALGLASQEKLQMDRLAATRDAALGLYGHNAAYYDQNLALFSTGWTEQRYRFDREGNLKVKWHGKSNAN